LCDGCTVPRVRKLIVPIVALALVGGLAACGGDDDEAGETGGDDFASQAEAICIEGAEAAREVNLEFGYATKSDDLIEATETLLDARQAALTDFEALEPPEELADAYDEYIAAREDVVATTEERLAALEDGDTAAVEASDGAFEEAVDSMEAAGADLELEACAGILPDDDAEAVEEVLLEYSTTTDAAVICEPGGISAEAFVEGGFGGVEPCLDQQHKLASEPDTLPEDIDVTKVSGIDDIAATIEYEEVGGAAEGEPLSAQLVYLDGEWKLFSVFAG